MGFLNRLGKVIEGYVNGIFEEKGADNTFFRGFGGGDPDLDAAYEELNDFLNQKDGVKHEPRQNDASKGVRLPPEELRADFEYLGVPFGADIETCKTAYKKLLKIHHPDRHAGHENNLKKATEKTAGINAAWDRIEKWHRIVESRHFWY